MLSPAERAVLDAALPEILGELPATGAWCRDRGSQREDRLKDQGGVDRTIKA